MKTLILFLATFMACTLKAQRHNGIYTYFVKNLQGDTTAAAPGKSFSEKKLKAQRENVWTAWCQANADCPSPTLLAEPDSLLQAKPHAWNLPAELEPHAVMPYYFGAKGQKPEAGYPLFLYLHGSGPKEHEWSTGLKLAGMFKDAPSMYFIPQIPNEEGWYRWWHRSKQYAWEQLLRQALLRTDIDPDRLYLFGISEGGYGSQRLASFYADYLAAAGPMAGGEPLMNAPAENVGNIGFSLRTGNEDHGFYRNKLTRYVREALDSLERLVPGKYHHNVELTPDQGHHIDYSPTTPWLLQFKRNPWPTRFIWEDYEMDGRHRNGFYNLWVHQRPHSQLRTRYEVKIEGNEVDITVENVSYTCTETDPVYGIQLKFNRSYAPAQHGHITLFLDEHLVELQHPVIVRVNGQTLHKSKLRLSTVNLAHSALVYGDPRRLYPAAVELRW